MAGLNNKFYNPTGSVVFSSSSTSLPIIFFIVLVLAANPPLSTYINGPA